MNLFSRTVSLTVLLSVMAPMTFAKGLTTSKERPKVRIGTLPFDNPHITDLFLYKEASNNLGKHHYEKEDKRFYESKEEEDRGIFYTCAVGFLDVAHLRAGIDYGAYFVKKFEEAYKAGKTSLSLQGQEPSLHKIKLSYPAGFSELSPSEKAATIKDMSVEVGLYFAHVSLVWHEVVSWYGWSSMGSWINDMNQAEKPSGFSYEDLISHVVGLQITKAAVLNNNLDYNEAVTLEMDRLLGTNGGGTYQRTDSDIMPFLHKLIDGDWYKRMSRADYITDRNRRNLPNVLVERTFGIGNYIKRLTNVGLKGEDIKPETVEGVSACANTPGISIKTPGALEVTSGKYAGLISIEIEPNLPNYGPAIMKDLPEGQKSINVEEDFGVIMQTIEDHMANEFGADIFFDTNR